MAVFTRALRAGVSLVLSAAGTRAQDLAPRAHVIRPTGSRAIIFSASLNKRDVRNDSPCPSTMPRARFNFGYWAITSR